MSTYVAQTQATLVRGPGFKGVKVANAVNRPSTGQLWPRGSGRQPTNAN